MTKTSKIEKVKTLVANTIGWDGVLRQYHCFRDAFDKMDNNTVSQVQCPFGGQGKTKFRFIFRNKNFHAEASAFHEDLGYLDGIEMVARAERCSTSEALDTIATICGGLDKVTDGMVRTYSNQVATKKELTEEEKQKRNEALNKVAMHCIHAGESKEVRTYLRRRGIKGDMKLLPKSLFFNPSLFYFEEDTKQKSFWPGLVASVTDANYDVVSLHRHYITKEGKKAPVNCAKKMMAPNVINMNGSSIKLDKPVYVSGHGLIGVCEGLETALAVREATGMPMWSGIDANKMRAMDIPDDVTTVVIWGDHDRSETGINRAVALKERLEKEVPGRTVIVHLPDQLQIPTKAKSVDWLDVYKYLGAEYFPMKVNSPEHTVKTGVELPSEFSEEAA